MTKATRTKKERERGREIDRKIVTGKETKRQDVNARKMKKQRKRERERESE